MKKKIIKKPSRFVLVHKQDTDRILCLKYTGYDIETPEKCKYQRYHGTSIFTPFSGMNPNDLYMTFSSKEEALGFAKYWDERTTAIELKAGNDERYPTYIQDNFKALKIGA